MKKITLLLTLLPLCAAAQTNDSIPGWWIDARLNGYYTDAGVFKKTFYKDQDADGFGDSAVFLIKYNQPQGYTLDNTDCNDANPLSHPGAQELCNNVDDDCDGLTEQTICDIITVTNTGRLIEKDLFSGCLEDVWFKGGEQNMIDIFGDPLFFPRLKAIGFTSLMYGNGSQNHAYQVDPLQPQDGYYCNGMVQEGNVKDVCDDYFGVDFFRLSVEMADSLGVPLNFVYNSEFGDTIQAKFMIEQGHSTIVGECTECNNLNGYNNAYSFPEGGKSYREKEDSTINKYLDAHYPDIKKLGDNNRPKEFKLWDDQVNGMNVDAFRLYLFDSMFMPADIGNDYGDYVNAINYGFANQLPAKIDSFRAKFPGYKLGFYEVGLNNSAPMPWYNTQMANNYLVKWYQWMVEYNLANDDFINVAVYKSIRSLSLSKATVKTHFYGLKQIGEVFKGDTVYTVNTAIPGVYGFGTERAIVIANDNSTDIPFTLEGFYPTAAAVEYSTGLNGTVITEASTPVDAALRKQSVTVFVRITQ